MTVYAVSEPGASLVKIGYSTDLSTRFRGLLLQSPVPLVIRAHWEGELADERALHRVFAEQRKHGEWFEFGESDPVGAISTALGRKPSKSLSRRTARRHREVADVAGVSRKSTPEPRRVSNHSSQLQTATEQQQEQSATGLATYITTAGEKLTIWTDQFGSVNVEMRCNGCVGLMATDTPHGPGTAHRLVMSREQFLEFGPTGPPLTLPCRGT